MEYDGDLEAGYKRSEKAADANGRDSRRRQRDPPPAELDMTADDEKVVESMIMANPAELPQPKAEITPAPAPQRKVHKARKSKKAPVAPASPGPADSADVVADDLEVVIEVPVKEVSAEEKEKPSKKGVPKTAKRAKIVEPAVEASALKPAPVDGTMRRRKMQKQTDWFDPDALAVSVPETIRYYLSATDGQPIVSWRDPESAGTQSKLPPGILFADGNMVNAKGEVKAPADRRANHACEACRARYALYSSSCSLLTPFSETKCDGYGDRPCSACMKLRKSTCVYKPWSSAQQRAHRAAIEYGTTSRRREVHGQSQRFRKNAPAASEVELSEKDQAIMQSMLTDQVPKEAFAKSLEDDEPVQEDSPPASPGDDQPVSPVDDFDFEVQVDDEIEVEPVSSERDEDEPMMDAPWPSLHDAEANHLEPVEASPEPQPPSPPVVQRKRKVNRAMEESEPAPAYKKKKTSAHKTIEVEECFAGLKPVRTLKKAQDWFDPDALPISVPYGIRYYLMPEDGTPVVSSAAPEKPGRNSKRPSGTLFEDGSIVNPNGKVESSFIRRANHACEMCRLR